MAKNLHRVIKKYWWIKLHKKMQVQALHPGKQESTNVMLVITI